MKKLNIIASALLMTLTLASLVSAFGVSAPYWEGNPLTMARGETVVVNLNLQNMVGEEDVNIKAELVKGEDITALKEDTFLVEAGTSDTLVPLKITMPRDAEAGESKTIHVEFKTVSAKEGGITMGTGMTVFFDVVATNEKRTNTAMIVTVVIALIILAIILWAAMKRKKRK